jgi:SRSO17 transposase
LAELVRLGKLRWRIEHDYRELTDALGLDHFEGRSYRGWHQHVTLVSVAHAFLTRERQRPRLRAATATAGKQEQASAVPGAQDAGRVRFRLPVLD